MVNAQGLCHTWLDIMQAHYRPFIVVDESSLLKLLKRVPPTIGRMSNKHVYKAIMDDALLSRNVVIFVALLDDKPVGYVIACWN